MAGFCSILLPKFAEREGFVLEVKNRFSEGTGLQGAGALFCAWLPKKHRKKRVVNKQALLIFRVFNFHFLIFELTFSL